MSIALQSQPASQHPAADETSHRHMVLPIHLRFEAAEAGTPDTMTEPAPAEDTTTAAAATDTVPPSGCPRAAAVALAVAAILDEWINRRRHENPFENSLSPLCRSIVRA